MKKKIITIICLCLCMGLLPGCGGQKQEEETTVAAEANDTAVIGTWSEPDFESGYIFNSDLTGKDTYWDLTFTYTAYDGVVTITYDDDTYATDRYSYTVDESGLTMTRITEKGDSQAFTYTRG